MRNCVVIQKILYLYNDFNEIALKLVKHLRYFEDWKCFIPIICHTIYTFRFNLTYKLLFTFSVHFSFSWALVLWQCFISLACPSFISTFVCTQSTNKKPQWAKHLSSHWVSSFLAVSQRISIPLSVLFPTHCAC